MINELIKKRRSTRAFSSQSIDADTLMSLFEASRWAASSMNEQPWRFVYRLKDDNPQEFDELFSTLMDGNKSWAGSAPLLIAVLAKTHFAYKDRPNRHYMYDTGQAVATMLVQLTDMGLVAHQMGGFHIDQAKEILSVDDDYEIAVIIAVGYPGDINTLPDDLKKRESGPRKRNELNDFVFKNRLN
ncbi:MAG: nitroreductase family protein [Calditrichaeota bacterium]|nr:nitroreductase family protein [Calditrichota bacterium]